MDVVSDFGDGGFEGVDVTADVDELAAFLTRSAFTRLPKSSILKSMSS